MEALNVFLINVFDSFGLTVASLTNQDWAQPLDYSEAVFFSKQELITALVNKNTH